MTINLFESVALLLGSLVGLAFLAFFTGSEIAIISADKVYLRRLKDKGIKDAIAALKLQENIDQLLTTTQLGANLSLAFGTTLATMFIRRIFPEQNEFLIIGIFTPFVLIFSDLLPKVIARHRADYFGLRLARPLYWFAKILRPVISVVAQYTAQLSRLPGAERHDSLSRRRKLREEVHSLLSDHDEENEIRHGQRRWIRKILEFSKHNVRKAQLPLVNVDAIESTATMEQAIEHFEKLRHSRIPIFQDRVDNIIGILDVKDVFFCQNLSDSVTKHMKKALFVPEYQQLAALTNQMKDAHTSMAIVVDEYGGAVGILTKEDVLEEIVGEISDEFDEHSLSFLEISPNTYLVNTSININELNERLHVKLPKGDYETLAGFLLQQFNCIPIVGDELIFSHLRFRVHKATEKALQTVIISAEVINNTQTPKEEK